MQEYPLRTDVMEFPLFMPVYKTKWYLRHILDVRIDDSISFNRSHRTNSCILILFHSIYILTENHVFCQAHLIDEHIPAQLYCDYA